MTDRSPKDGFETRVTTLVRSYTEPAAKRIDPVLMARTAMASTARGGVLGKLLPVRRDRRVAWLLLLGAIVVTIAALAVAVGSRSSLFVHAPDGPARIVFVRDGDLFVAEIDGSGQRLIASGDAGDNKLGYLTAAWSPDTRHIAAVRDVGGPFLTPSVDLMTADGALVRTVALEPGCGPSITWGPDSSEVAIATCPADVPRDTIKPVDSRIGLLIAGLDAAADREIALPPEWRSVATARREVWIRPDLWARWSPDGQWIAVPASVAGQGGQYLVAADGSGTRPIEKFTRGLIRVGFLDWSPDGRGLATSGDSVGCVEGVCLGIVPFEGGPVSTVTHPLRGNPKWPEFSPDGGRVAVLGGMQDFTAEPQVDETNTLYSYDLATAHFTELTSGGRSLVLDATRAATPTGSVTGELVEGGSVAWTPDGGKLLFLVPEDGASPASWVLRAIDAAGESESTVLVRGVQAFDIGGPRP
jgi:dipeptidyl aminopeptidase/acylaminoacyl peptidase